MIFRRKPHTIGQNDLKLLADLQMAMHHEQRWGAQVIVGFLCLMIGLFLFWASTSHLEEITKGTGRVIPSSREQVIQSLDAGTLSEMRVKEGDVVEKDQVLLRLDSTRSTAVYREGLTKSQTLDATAARLRSEAYGGKLVFPALPPELISRERSAYAARVGMLNQSIQGLKTSKALLEREIAITEPMVKEGVMSEVELLRMKRQASDLGTQLSERLNKFRTDANTDLLKVEAEASQIRENLVGRDDAVKRTEMRAPLRGIVKNVRINTVGGVVTAGQDILEIVPLDETLLIETYIRPSDVAFIRPGLPAVVKHNAYDFAVYGGMDGVVEMISPDTMRDDKRSATSSLNLNPDENYYRVLVRTTGNSLKDKNGQILPIIPGMTATVDIKTGEKTILEFLLKPIAKLQQAFRER